MTANMTDLVKRLRCIPRGIPLAETTGAYIDIGDEAADELTRLRERLEMTHAYRMVDGKLERVEADMSDHDGISCRDETIKLQGSEITALRARVAELEEVVNTTHAHLCTIDAGTGMAEVAEARETLRNYLSSARGRRT